MATIENGYPLDPTGVSPNNAVKGELHTFINKKARVFALNYGAFYATSLKVTDKASGKPLTPNQFIIAYRVDFPSAKFNNEVAAIVVITDAAVGLQVLVDYQAVGGIYSYAGDLIAKTVKAALTANRSVHWPEMVQPQDTEPPNEYAMWPLERVGFEHATMALARLRDAIQYGNIAAYRRVGAYARVQSEAFPLTARNLFEMAIARHSDLSNPHPQYVQRNMLNEYVPWIRTPVNVYPGRSATGLPYDSWRLDVTPYRGLYGIALRTAWFQYAENPEMTNSRTFTMGYGTSLVVNNIPLKPNTRYYWRVRYENADGQVSAWSQITDFRTAP